MKSYHAGVRGTGWDLGDPNPAPSTTYRDVGLFLAAVVAGIITGGYFLG